MRRAVVLILFATLLLGARSDVTAVKIAPDDEPGRRLEFSGRVLDHAGNRLSKAAVIAYNTDASGLYNPRDSRTRTPRLRGAAVTDEDGRFRFSTVWPGAYPNETNPAHIHIAAVAPAHDVRYIEVWFDDDPLVTKVLRDRVQRGGDTFIVKPVKSQNDVWTFAIDIKLAAN